MKIVVVGATGNIGSALLRALVAEAAVHEVLGVARRPPVDRSDPVRWVAADIGVDALREVFDGADAVVHLAWAIQPSHQPSALWRTNVVGAGRVFEAVARAAVPVLVYVSSVGAYAPGPKDRPVDEAWPTEGLPGLGYAWQKAYVERALDAVEARNPQRRVVRLRPALVLQRGAGPEIWRLFVGGVVPPAVAHPALAGALRRLPTRVQVVHADDVADAIRRALVGDVRGTFNLAAAPVLGSLGRMTRPAGAALRAATAAGWHARLLAAPPGWVELLFRVPVLDTGRAERELGWCPRVDALAAVREVLAGIREVRVDPATPALQRPGRAR